jgi:hypothetical protein
MRAAWQPRKRPRLTAGAASVAKVVITWDTMRIGSQLGEHRNKQILFYESDHWEASDLYTLTRYMSEALTAADMLLVHMARLSVGGGPLLINGSLLSPLTLGVITATIMRTTTTTRD